MQSSPAAALVPFVTAETGDEVSGLWNQFVVFWTTKWDDVLWTIVAIVVIVVVALLVRWLLHFVIVRVVDQIVSGVKRKQDVTDTQALMASPVAAVRTVQRTRTLGTVLTNIVNVTITIIAVLAIVQTINSDILGSFALLTAALGAGLGFGAQNIVKDVLNGLFMVIEDQLGVGDIVDLGFATGVVEEVRIRVTIVRDVNGTLWFVRNGEILRVGNLSQGWARAIIDVSVPRTADVDAVEGALLDTAIDLSQTSKWRTRFVERPEVWGIESISADAVVLRVVAKTRPAAKDDVAEELRGRIKHALEQQGVDSAAIASVLPSGVESVTRVRGAHPPRTRPTPLLPPEEPAKKGRKTKRAARPGVLSTDAAGAGRPKTPGMPIVAPARKPAAKAPAEKATPSEPTTKSPDESTKRAAEPTSPDESKTDD
ncbi:mechanosensitive ion channel family protein [Agromyces seonyuensis]|uniref:Mechanosensitive ion channel n=1 Tax=Agromyces seonyuensis TaxID=2662446 RepID=A0A6I4NTA3_9MICO|nr:mechanosensitive ion channel domain-containing protein [Agromyces seonyuensis]MWB97361.1 mechanosensitive ion channel [Agromyces seonyuensis]